MNRSDCGEVGLKSEEVGDFDVDGDAKSDDDQLIV